MNITYQVVDMFLAGLPPCRKCALPLDTRRLHIMDQLTQLMMPGVCPPPGRHELVLQETCGHRSRPRTAKYSVLVGDDGSLRV